LLFTFVKMEKSFGKIAYFEDRLEYSFKTITNIPKTSIHYDTWDSAPFKRYGEKRMPQFKSKELENLWMYAHGTSYKGLGLHPQQLSRLLRKYIKESMEREYSQFTRK